MELSALIIVVLGIVFKTNNEKGKKAFIVCSMMILFLEAALRHQTVGGDLIGYLYRHEINSHYSFNQMIAIYTAPDSKDPVFYFTGWLVSKIFSHEQWWLVIIAALFNGSITWLIWRESKNPLISIIMFLALGYYDFSLTGLRQAMAIAILVFSFYFLKERKLIPFVLMVILASLYHQTALVFLVIYPFANVKLGKYHIMVALGVLIVFYAFRAQLLSFLSDALQEERYQGYTSGEASTLTMSGFIIQAAIFAYNLFYYKKVIKRDEKAIILYNLAFTGLMFQLYASFIAEMFRISMYFSVFNIVLVPLTTMEEENKNIRMLITFGLILILLLYTFKDGITPYRFFWQ